MPTMPLSIIGPRTLSPILPRFLFLLLLLLLAPLLRSLFLFTALPMLSAPLELICPASTPLIARNGCNSASLELNPKRALYIITMISVHHPESIHSAISIRLRACVCDKLFIDL